MGAMKSFSTKGAQRRFYNVLNAASNGGAIIERHGRARFVVLKMSHLRLFQLLLHRYADETAKTLLNEVQAAIRDQKGERAEKLMHEYEWYMGIADNMRHAVRPHAGLFDDDADAANTEAV